MTDGWVILELRGAERQRKTTSFSENPGLAAEVYLQEPTTMARTRGYYSMPHIEYMAIYIQFLEFFGLLNLYIKDC